MSPWPVKDMTAAPRLDIAAPGVTAIDDPFRGLMFKAVLGIALLDPIIILVVLAVVGVRWWLIAIIVVAAMAIPALVIWIIAAMMWNPAARRYPAQAILPGAVSKDWQSFRFGLLSGFNNCVTIIADQQHLHLRPFAPLRWFGARRISLPLDRMSDLRPAFGGLIKAKFDRRTVAGPEWCMRLAQPVEQRDEPQEKCGYPGPDA